MREFISERARAVTVQPQTSVDTSGLINLASGTPDFRTPEFILEAMIDSLRNHKLQYTAWTGMPVLRRAIAAKLERENELRVDPDQEILVTAGAQEALMTVLMTLLDPGDEILITDPHYGVYSRAATIAGADMRLVPTEMTRGFVPHPGDVEQAITQRTKAIVVVSPSNPTGAVFPRDVLEEIVAIAIAHDLVIVSDEIYEHYVFDDAVHTTVATLPGARDRTITINSLSKGYALTGIRLGYIVGWPEFVRAAVPFHHAMTICAPVTAQHGAVAALKSDRGWFAPILEEYDRRRRAWMSTLDRIDLPYARPRGAYYIYVDIGPTDLDVSTFVRRARDDAGLMLGVGGPGCIRGSLMQASPGLEEGLGRLARFVEGLRASDPVARGG